MSKEKSLPPGVVDQTAVKDWLFPRSMSPLVALKDCVTHAVLADMENVGNRNNQACSSPLSTFPRPLLVTQEMRAAGREPVPAFSVITFKHGVRHRSYSHISLPIQGLILGMTQSSGLSRLTPLGTV